MTHQDLAALNIYPNVGLAQGVPEHGQVIFTVSALSFLYIFLIGLLAPRRTKEMTSFLATVLRMLYQALSRTPFLIHGLAKLLPLASQWQR